MELNELLEKQFEKQDSILAELKTAQESRVKALETENATLKTRLDEIETKMNRTVTVTRDEADKPFPTFGEQLAAIVKAGNDPMNVDKRLLAINEKAASGGSALVATDGAFVIQRDHAEEIFRILHGTASMYAKCKKHNVSENADGLEVPYIDETSRATGSRWGGVQVYRAAEADSVTAKKPKIGKMETRLEDLRGLAYMTDRLLRDARAMSSVYSEAFAEEFAWTIDNEIFRGTGVAQCLGVLNCGALVSVAKETGQLAATIMFENVVKMVARLHSRSMARAEWFINQDIFPQLFTMQFTIGTGGVPVYLPPSGAAASPYGTLFGRPVHVIEQASTLGTQGDIVLADLSQYQLVEKGGLQGASSIHVRFINHEQTFRWNWSINGQPKWKQAITPANGTNTVSPFIALDTRS